MSRNTCSKRSTTSFSLIDAVPSKLCGLKYRPFRHWPRCRVQQEPPGKTEIPLNKDLFSRTQSKAIYSASASGLISHNEGRTRSNDFASDEKNRASSDSW